LTAIRWGGRKKSSMKWGGDVQLRDGRRERESIIRKGNSSARWSRFTKSLDWGKPQSTKKGMEKEKGRGDKNSSRLPPQAVLIYRTRADAGREKKEYAGCISRKGSDVKEIIKACYVLLADERLVGANLNIGKKLYKEDGSKRRDHESGSPYVRQEQRRKKEGRRKNRGATSHSEHCGSIG